MKINCFMLGACLSLMSFFGSAIADTKHHHDTFTENGGKPLVGVSSYNCNIRILNQSFDKLEIQGIFDDGSRLSSFVIYPYEPAHEINLFYYGYCHAGMDLYIDTIQGYRVYGGYTRVNNTIRIVPHSVGLKATA